MAKIFVLIITLLCILSVANASENISPCATEVLIKWVPGGEPNYGVIYPEVPAEEEKYVTPDEINMPRVITLDSKNNIYVGDPVNYRVFKFNKDGKLLLKILLQKPIRTPNPPSGHIIPDMTIDKFDNLYVINLYEYRIEVYNPKGKFVRMINYLNDKLEQVDKNYVGKTGIYYEPEYIDIYRDGKIYIYSDYLLNFAMGGVYSPEGSLLKKGISFDEFGGRKKFKERMVRFNGYYLETFDIGRKGKNDSIAVLKDAANKEINRCAINAELSTKTKEFVDKDGNVYFFEYNTLNIVKAKMLKK